MSNPVLVTGAFGQVGKRCTEILLSRGRTVVATDLRTDSVVATADELGRGQHPGRLRTVYADLIDAAQVQRELGWEPQPVERSVRDAAKFFVAQRD